MNDRFRFRVWCEEKRTYWAPKIIEETTLFVLSRLSEKKNIVEQCTGLKDKNGKLIYEGDIIKDLTFNEDLAIIKFGDSGDYGGGYQCFYPEWLGKYSKSTKYSIGWRRGLVWWCNSGIEVIGNIHENHELLEGK